jgi:hypothetical protein
MSMSYCALPIGCATTGNVRANQLRARWRAPRGAPSARLGSHLPQKPLGEVELRLVHLGGRCAACRGPPPPLRGGRGRTSRRDGAVPLHLPPPRSLWGRVGEGGAPPAATLRSSTASSVCNSSIDELRPASRAAPPHPMNPIDQQRPAAPPRRRRSCRRNASAVGHGVSSRSPRSAPGWDWPSAPTPAAGTGRGTTPSSGPPARRP